MNKKVVIKAKHRNQHKKAQAEAHFTLLETSKPTPLGSLLPTLRRLHCNLPTFSLAVKHPRSPASPATNEPHPDVLPVQRGETHPPRAPSIIITGFPGGAVAENLPANAGDMGLSPGLGRSHMPRSNWAREPQLLSLRVWSLCSTTREATMVRGPRTVMKSGPRSPQLEKALAQKNEDPTQPKKLIN